MGVLGKPGPLCVSCHHSAQSESLWKFAYFVSELGTKTRASYMLSRSTEPRLSALELGVNAPVYILL